MQTKHAHKNAAQRDRDPIDIIAELWRRRLSLRRLSREHGYAAGSLRKVLRHQWPEAERIVAAAIGAKPQQVWPSRYHADGTPRGRRSVGRGER